MSESFDESASIRMTTNDGMASITSLDSRRATRARREALEVELELGSENPAPEASAMRQKYFGVVLSGDTGESEQDPWRA